MKYLFPLTAIHHDGHTVMVYTVEAFRNLKGSIGIRHRYTEYVYNRVTRSYGYEARLNDWIVRDDAGRVILPGAFDQPPSANWKKHRRNRCGNFDFRDGPVPGVRRHWRRASAGARKRHGGRGVTIRNATFHSSDPMHELDGE